MLHAQPVLPAIDATNAPFAMPEFDLNADLNAEPIAIESPDAETRLLPNVEEHLPEVMPYFRTPRSPPLGYTGPTSVLPTESTQQVISSRSKIDGESAYPNGIAMAKVIRLATTIRRCRVLGTIPTTKTCSKVTFRSRVKTLF